MCFVAVSACSKRYLQSPLLYRSLSFITECQSGLELNVLVYVLAANKIYASSNPQQYAVPTVGMPLGLTGLWLTAWRLRLADTEPLQAVEQGFGHLELHEDGCTVHKGRRLATHPLKQGVAPIDTPAVRC
jgi:hypothetical protein